MAKAERIYRRTESGARAWEDQDPSLSVEHRRLLGRIQGDTHWDELRKLLQRSGDYQRLADLEAKGLVVSEAAAPGSDLDFTGNFAFGRN